MKTAKFIKRVSGWGQSIKLWELSEPIACHHGHTSIYVVTSSIVKGPLSPFGETMAFLAYENGHPMCYAGLATNEPQQHVRTVRELGYEIE